MDKEQGRSGQKRKSDGSEHGFGSEGSEKLHKLAGTSLT